MSDRFSEQVLTLAPVLEMLPTVASTAARRSGAGCGPHLEGAEPKTGCGYRGSWAEQSVVARLARKRTPKAIRMTTTPPTVNRSQRSEFLPVSNSRFAAMDLVLMTHSTEADGNCSDHGHNQVPDRILPLSHGHRDQNIPTITSLLSFF